MSNEFNDILDILAKKEAPVVARTRRKILKETGIPASKRKKLKPKTLPQVQKTEAVHNFEQPLAKNEYEIIEKSDGEIKMEFGPEVPDIFKKRAMEWAKKRGLKTKEMSLEKSTSSNFWVVFK
jgi:hypothetical protein